MRSNLDTIKPKLYEKYPKIKPETLDNLIEVYFKSLKKNVASLDKLEVSVLWGTLKMSERKIKNQINYIDHLLSNVNTPINKLTEKRIEYYKTKKEILEKRLEERLLIKKEGKINKSRLRKAERNNNSNEKENKLT